MKRIVIFVLSAIVALWAVSQSRTPRKLRSKPKPTASVNPTSKPQVAEATSVSIAGHEYVDLGLSVKWATCNVGATSPSDYGGYYAWGETSTKTNYTGENCKSDGKKMGDISGNATYDAARAEWGGSWRMPTKAEMQELVDNCTWTWTTQEGTDGYKVTGKNGNSIFLPAAGHRYGKAIYNIGVYGGYWCSTPVEDDANSAYRLFFTNTPSSHVDTTSNDEGRSVRPVTE